MLNRGALVVSRCALQFLYYLLQTSEIQIDEVLHLGRFQNA